MQLVAFLAIIQISFLTGLWVRVMSTRVPNPRTETIMHIKYFKNKHRVSVLLLITWKVGKDLLSRYPIFGPLCWIGYLITDPHHCLSIWPKSRIEWVSEWFRETDACKTDTKVKRGRCQGIESCSCVPCIEANQTWFFVALSRFWKRNENSHNMIECWTKTQSTFPIPWSEWRILMVKLQEKAWKSRPRRLEFLYTTVDKTISRRITGFEYANQYLPPAKSHT